MVDSGYKSAKDLTLEGSTIEVSGYKQDLKGWSTLGTSKTLRLVPRDGRLWVQSQPLKGMVDSGYKQDLKGWSTLGTNKT